MIEAKAPAAWPEPPAVPLIFLAGSIDMGAAEDWRQRLVRELADQNVILLNPRRTDWDATWVQSKDDARFREQVNWEQDGLDSADLRVFVFLPNSRSPITLFELGLFKARRGVVCCPPGFYRKGNVDICCEREDMDVVDSLEDLVAYVKRWLRAWHPGARLDRRSRGGSSR